MEMGKGNMNNIEEDKLEKLKNEISDLEKMLEKKNELEELERKKSALEEELNLGIKKMEGDTSSLHEKTEGIPIGNNLNNSDENKNGLEKDEEVEYVSYEEIEKKVRNKWIAIGAAAVITTIGIMAFQTNIQKNKEEKNLAEKIEEVEKAAKEKAESEAKAQMELKLTEEKEKLRLQAEKEVAERIAANSIIAQGRDAVMGNQATNQLGNNEKKLGSVTRETGGKDKRDEKVNNGENKKSEKKLEIPEIDTKQLKELGKQAEELGKQAKETQKNVEDFIEKKGGIQGIVDNITSGLNSFMKGVGDFFGDLFGNSASDNKDKEQKK